jgi:hypothetical protein
MMAKALANAIEDHWTSLLSFEDDCKLPKIAADVHFLTQTA